MPSEIWARLEWILCLDHSLGTIDPQICDVQFDSISCTFTLSWPFKYIMAHIFTSMQVFASNLAIWFSLSQPLRLQHYVILCFSLLARLKASNTCSCMLQTSSSSRPPYKSPMGPNYMTVFSVLTVFANISLRKITKVTHSLQFGCYITVM